MYHDGDWNKIANLNKIKNNDGSKKEVVEQIDKYFNNLIEYNSIKPASNIYEAVYKQHKNADKNDFSHMGATMSTYFHWSIYKSLSFVDGLRPEEDKVFNGVTGVEANAGYIGDICGNKKAMPSINKSDYAADLDAVNLYYRIKKNNKESLYEIFSKYYEEIENGKTNRAKEFLTHISIGDLYEYRKNYDDYIKRKYRSDKLGYINRLNYYDNFVEHLNNGENEFAPIKYYDYNEYNQTTKEMIVVFTELNNVKKVVY